MQSDEAIPALSDWQEMAVREAVAAADLASAEDFVEHEQVKAWLASWGTDHEESSVQLIAARFG
jgi:predicted transcriptional regulator